jgi:DNA-binding beta-propeller fold protein YncE
MRRLKSKLTAAFLLAALAATAGDTAALTLVQTIPLPGVKGRFDHFAIDTKGQRLFVAALGNNTLETIDLAAGKRLGSLPGMAKPTGVLYLPEADQILVANGDDGTLKTISGSDDKVLRQLPGLDDADNLRLDPKTKLAWLGYGGGALAVIDPAGAKALATVKLPAHPESFQIDPDGSQLFVNLPDAKQIAIIDREKRVVTGAWPLDKFQANFPIALDASHHRLFVGCRRPSRLLVFDTLAGKPIADLPISGDTDDLFYDAARKRIYVSCGEGFLDTIEQTTPDTYRPHSKLPTSPGARTSFFSPTLDRLYLAVPASGLRHAEIRVYRGSDHR